MLDSLLTSSPFFAKLPYENKKIIYRTTVTPPRLSNPQNESGKKGEPVFSMEEIPIPPDLKHISGNEADLGINSEGQRSPEPALIIQPVKDKPEQYSLIRLKSESGIQITPIIPRTPPILPADHVAVNTDNEESCGLEPSDLSSRKPENVTCVPEIDFIKEEVNDAASDYSNSSDPERLEVDMSQVCNRSVHL